MRNFIGGLTMVGEAGQELVRLPRGSDVIPNHMVPSALRSESRPEAQRLEDVEQRGDRPMVFYIDRMIIEGNAREALESLGLQTMAGMGS